MRPKKNEPCRGRLLAEWAPPPNAGEPLACLASSYTFDSVFFEEQCLARFAGIRSSSGEGDDAFEYIIEREERLSQIRAVVLVDKEHCRGTRSPRWDLLCARGSGGGILHAKLALLIWERRMRLIVASANLTEPGYRRNREAYCSLEAGGEEALAAEAFNDGLVFLRRLGALGGDAGNPAIARWYAVVEEARARLSSHERETDAEKPAISFVGIEPGGSSLFRQLANAWNPRYGNTRSIRFASPFFDNDAAQAERAIDGLWALGAKTGPVHLQAWIPAERECVDEGPVRLLAPEALERLPRSSCDLQTMAVFEDTSGERRSLHAKAFALASDAGELLYVGSSNLTCAGTGLGPVVNFEAGLCYLSSESKARAAMMSFWDSFEGVDVEGGRFEGSKDDEESSEDRTLVPLPSAFLYALFCCEAGTSTLKLAIEEGPFLPQHWSISDPDGEAVADSSSWSAAGRPSLYLLEYFGTKAPSGLELSWMEGEERRRAWLPVCISSMRDLPPPEELRALPLEVLIDILGSARPLARIVASHRRSIAPAYGGDTVELDPHKRVDTSDFLIQRARRASLAISGLAARLSEPCPSREAFEWRLYGPCGAMAVEDALKAASKDAAEDLFYRIELYLELMGAGARERREAIRDFVLGRIDAMDPDDFEGLGESLAGYCDKAFRRIREIA